MQLAKVYDQITAVGAVLWAISPQTLTDNQNLRQRRHLPFPILADTDLAVIRAWGLFHELDAYDRLIPYPATYIVGQDGRCVRFWLGLETRDRPTPGEVLAAVPALNKGLL